MTRKPKRPTPPKRVYLVIGRGWQTLCLSLTDARHELRYGHGEDSRIVVYVPETEARKR